MSHYKSGSSYIATSILQRSWISENHQPASYAQDANCSKVAFGAKSAFHKHSSVTDVALLPTGICLSVKVTAGDGGKRLSSIYTVHVRGTNLQVMGEKDKETKPIPAGLYSIWSVGKVM